MGAYLSQPNTAKESFSGSGHDHVWGISSMQGWRTNMEDSHIAISDLGNAQSGMALFGVFDGHGGKEVAMFCREHMPDEVRRQLSEIEGTGSSSPSASRERPDDVEKTRNCEQAMVRAFHGMDEMLRQPERQRELLKFKQGVMSVSSDEPASSAASSAASSEDEEEKKPKVVAALQTSIQTDLSSARDRGSLTKEEATQVMLKLQLLRRLENNSISESQGPVDNVGCTAVCVVITAEHLVTANAGDSRAILCRKGEVVELSHDHKPNSEIEKSRIEAAGGRVEEIPVGTRVHYRVNGNLNLSRAIGDMEYKKRSDLPAEEQMICATPDIISIERSDDDEFIVLACDGIWDVKTNEQVAEFVGERLRRGVEIPKLIEELLDDCIVADPKETHGLGADNMTCIVVQFKPGS